MDLFLCSLINRPGPSWDHVFGPSTKRKPIKPHRDPFYLPRTHSRSRGREIRDKTNPPPRKGGHEITRMPLNLASSPAAAAKVCAGVRASPRHLLPRALDHQVLPPFLLLPQLVLALELLLLFSLFSFCSLLPLSSVAGLVWYFTPFLCAEPPRPQLVVLVVGGACGGCAGHGRGGGRCVDGDTG